MSPADTLPAAGERTFSAVGVDVGGTKIAAGLVNFPSGEVCARRQIPTSPSRGGEAVLADVLRLCQELARDAAGQRRPIAALGLGVCELVDREGNVVSENCIAWKGIPIAERLSQVAPAVIEADVRAAALAEAVFGAGRTFKQFLYVTIGTGISSCLVLEGQPFAGAHGATGTMASSPLSVPCEQCGHMSHRTLEEIASGPALLARYRQRGFAGAANAQEVLAAAVAGESDAAAVVQTAADALGSSLGSLLSVLDPEALIVGGGLGLSKGPFWEGLVASTRRHIWSEAHRHLPIVQALTGVDAGWIGAAAAAWKKHC